MQKQSWMLALAIGAACDGCQSETEQAQRVDEINTALTIAPIDLIAIGSLSGTARDLSTETSAVLENGVPGNLLGGLGSGLAFVGNHTFFAVPDRGPNATPYNSAVDDTASYINRFQTVRLRLKPSPAGATLPFTLKTVLHETTLLSSKDPLTYGSGTGLGVGDGAPALNAKHAFYFTGRSDNFDPAFPSNDPNDARFDPESIRVSNDSKQVYISDEYGPFIYQFERHTGKRVRSIALPPELAIANSNPQGALEISGNTAGRVANKGMEGLAITPDGNVLVGAMQSPLLQDGGTDAGFTRLVRIDLATGTTEQFAYPLSNIGTAAKPKYPTISDIVAINEHEFLVDERDGKGLGDDSSAAFKQIQHIDLTGAANVTGLSGAASLGSKAITKTLFLDVVATLNAHGIVSEDIPAKLEGLTFGPDLILAGAMKHTLYLANDNDFLGTITDSNHPTGIDNSNKFFVFAIDETTLPSFEQQQAVDPEDQDDASDDGN